MIIDNLLEPILESLLILVAIVAPSGSKIVVYHSSVVSVAQFRFIWHMILFLFLFLLLFRVVMVPNVLFIRTQTNKILSSTPRFFLSLSLPLPPSLSLSLFYQNLHEKTDLTQFEMRSLVGLRRLFFGTSFVISRCFFSLSLLSGSILSLFQSL